MRDEGDFVAQYLAQPAMSDFRSDSRLDNLLRIVSSIEKEPRVGELIAATRV